MLVREIGGAKLSQSEWYPEKLGGTLGHAVLGMPVVVVAFCILALMFMGVMNIMLGPVLWLKIVVGLGIGIPLFALWLKYASAAFISGYRKEVGK